MLIINKKYRTGKEFKRVMGNLFESGAGNQPSDIKKSKAECFYINLESCKPFIEQYINKDKIWLLWGISFQD